MSVDWNVSSSRTVMERNMLLRSVFDRPGFNLIHVNPGSFQSHVSETRALINNANVHAISVVETWFNSSMNDRAVNVNIPGFTLIRHDRENRIGGGVALYLRKSFKFRILAKSRSNAHTEFLFIEVSAPHDNILICVVYNPPSNKTLDTLESHLVKHCSNYRHVLVAGDFNIDSLSKSKDVTDFKGIISAADLHSNSKNATHHTRNCRSTQIDYILSHHTELFNVCGQMHLGSFTGHDLLYVSYDFDTLGMGESFTFQYRAIDKIDAAALNLRASQLDFSPIYNTTNVDEMVEKLTQNLSLMLNEFAPLKNKVVHHSTYPAWYNKKVIDLIDLRNFHHTASKSRSSTSEFHKTEAKKLNNLITTMKRDLRYKYFLGKFNFDLPPKVLWNNLRNFGIVRHSQDNNSNFTSGEINEHFVNSFSQPEPAINFSHEFPDRSNEFSFIPTNELEVFENILSIKSNAKGIDEFPISFIKKISPTIVPILTYIINCCIMRSEFPNQWKMANVIALPKVSSPNSPDDFRPISILPCMSKVFEKILESQIQSSIKRSSFISSSQSGFRNFHSTTTALLKIHNDLTGFIDDKKAAILVLLDFKKAFDRVPHNSLVRKLYNKFNFSRCASKLISHFLSNRKQRVIGKDGNSEFVDITSGTPQGSIISALLFSLFINDIVEFLERRFPNVHIHLYADDTQIYFSFDPSKVNESIRFMNEVLLTVEQWCNTNNVVINAKKSQAMLISNALARVRPTNTLTINGETIDWVDSARNLGFQMNSTLTHKDHINNISNQAIATISMLRQSRVPLTQGMRLHLVKTLVLPKFLYCSQIYQFTIGENWKTLDRAFKIAIRYIFSLGYKDPVSHLFPIVINCKSLGNYLKMHFCLFLYRLLKTSEPKYLLDELDYTTNARHVKFVPKHRHYVSTAMCFYSDGLRKVWNSLPDFVRRERSLEQFKILLSSHFRNLA